MSTEMKHNEEEPGTYSFSDEIFQWPIAKLDNIHVWQVLSEKYLTNPLDIKNLLVASPQFFGPLLEDKKCSSLVGEVLHILHKKNYLKTTNAEFLEYRSLSKPCKKTIDMILQWNNPCFQNLDGIDHYHDDYSNPRRHLCWEDFGASRGRKMHQKIEDYASVIRSGTIVPAGSHPFLCGFIAFSKHWLNTDGVSWLSLIQNFRLVLSIVGTQIYHFRFDLFHGLTFSYQELLWEFLGMMPNLQTLLLENYEEVKSLPKVDRRFFEDNTLPRLDHLEVLKTISVPNEIVNALISKYGPQLKKISVSIPRSSGENYMYHKEIFSPAINLNELSVPQISTAFNIGYFLRNIVKQTSTLKCLTVNIKIREAESQRTEIFQELTSALRDLFEAAQLHTLNLFVKGYMLNDGNNFFGNNEVRLKLPSLKRLWINIEWVKFSSIDFILGVSDSLEQLVLNMGRSTPEDMGQSEVIQFKNCWKKMEQSNVWKLMPRLQKISINCVLVSTRGEQYQEYKKWYVSSRPSILL